MDGITRKETSRSIDRDRKIVSLLPRVEQWARRLSRRIHGQVEVEELVSAGTAGLVEAADSFEEERGTSFETHAFARVRGAMLDEIRRRDPVRRMDRLRARNLTDTQRRLEQRLLRSPEPHEVALALNISVEELNDLQHKLACQDSLCVDEPVPVSGGKRMRLQDVLASGEFADEDAERESRIQWVRGLLLDLTEQERTVLTLYYYEEQTTVEIAEVLQLTNGRISQIRGKAMSKLLAKMSPGSTLHRSSQTRNRSQRSAVPAEARPPGKRGRRKRRAA